ncbi:MAG TPA: hypothetical protein VH208_14410 [Myxococcaceae bacterium]|nr:hypothetical protein [Myxococcaceae bacterium]
MVLAGLAAALLSQAGLPEEWVCSPPTTLATDLLGVSDVVLAPGAVFMASRINNTITRIPESGGKPTTIALGELHAGGLAIWRKRILWTTSVDGRVRSATFEGNSPDDLALGQSDPRAIATEEDHVFWTNGADGTVVAFHGGAREPIADGQFNPGPIAATRAGVYWANGSAGTVTRFDREAHHLDVIATNQVDTVSIAAGRWGDHPAVFWANRGIFPSRRSPVAVPGSVGMWSEEEKETRMLVGDINPEGLAASTQALWWTKGAEVDAMRIGQEQPFTCATGKNHPSRIAADNRGVVWLAVDALRTAHLIRAEAK